MFHEETYLFLHRPRPRHRPKTKDISKKMMYKEVLSAENERNWREKQYERKESCLAREQTNYHASHNKEQWFL